MKSNLSSVPSMRSSNEELLEQCEALRRENEELKAQQAVAQKIASVASHSESAVVIADPHGRIEWVNAGFEKLSGYTLEEAHGKSPGDLLQCPETSAETIHYMSACIAKGEGFHVEVLNAHRSGRRYWVSLEVQPVLDAAGNVLQFTAVESDITERKQAESRLALQFAVSDLVARHIDADACLHEALGTLGAHLGWRSAVVWLREQRTTRRSAQWVSAGEELGIPADSPEERELLEMSFAVGSPWIEQPPCATDGARGNPHCGLQIVPLRAGGSTVGVMAFYANGNDSVDAASRNVIQTVSSQLAQFVVRASEAGRAQRLAQELQVIFELSPDGFVAFNAAGRRLYANPAFTRLTGIQRDDANSLQKLEETMAGKCSSEYAYVPIANSSEQDGEIMVLSGPPQVWLLRQVRRIDALSDASTALVVYLRDITREKEVERMKSEFLSTAAHELRTPMASIHGFSELLLLRKFSEEKQKDMLTRIHRQSLLLTNMVNELLDLARIEARAGKDFMMQRMALQGLLRDTVGALIVSGDERVVRMEIADALPEVTVDADKMRQAITNVLSNAYKYSPDGGEISLYASAERDESGNCHALIEVRDRGIGMTPEQLAHVFERFWRADTSGRIPGTGLGLCLVKEIVEIQGGSIKVSSTPGQGTCVRIRMPAASTSALPVSQTAVS